MANIGFRILPLTHRPDHKLLDQFLHIATPLLSDNMNRLQGTSSELRPFHPSCKLVGTAFTEMAEPGDVIVVDAGGDMTQAIIGEIMLCLAQKKGIAGYVIDGAIRDSAAFRERDFPCYARGVTHRGPYKDGPGEINVPITIGNMVVHPGDIIVGDEDGIIAVPLAHAVDIARLAREQLIRENLILESIENGTIDRLWVDETLRQKRCDLL
jgi:regulator of RNase E activity RraA